MEYNAKNTNICKKKAKHQDSSTMGWILKNSLTVYFFLGFIYKKTSILFSSYIFTHF